MTVTIGQLAADAGYRTARLRDVPAVLRLTGQAERAHPGLLGRASRTLPGAVIRPLVRLAVFAWLAAGLVVFDPTGAAVVVLPVAGVGNRRAATVVWVLAGSVVGLAAVWGVAGVVALMTEFGFADVSIVLAWIIGVGAVISGVPRYRELASAERAAVAAADGGPVVEPGAYFGVGTATASMATALLATADRHGIWTVVQTSGEARIRLYRRFGFIVVGVPDPITARHEPRVFMLRAPGGAGGEVVEADPVLWRRRPRPGPDTSSDQARETAG